ncbi:MAG: hypothetical protein KJ614_05895 [Gammaproteobacteria bacterium]|uniref:hypothetical protein n=1 Tax=Rhodoferax sp. TaxID=50421 RepID=UPI0017E4F5AC|nr:hypothetical protein [Rhodoferax sp.]MBU3898450.1 hypothetical protein [Gammaproteobacteria bacterium]MBA3059318.1 hypothetical protein [Rhodoferax sp.]MBU3998560.1 hypothetical protein [Gammaproteobacteria bacterium]MBU4079224.1 hypothetical protein [Gammaproteobacteria bacterium]MBU4114826.1 hypothetical protein [Gammaproteobacteria bacterium]
MSKGNIQSKDGFVQRNQWRLILGGVILLLAALLGWKYYDNRYPSWYEEVRLSDGRVITIHQKHEYFDNYGTNQSWVEINLPELGGKRVWHSYLMPMRVDVLQGVVYVFGRPRGSRQLDYYRHPINQMVAFKWTTNEFVRIPFLQVPEIFRQEENVYSCVPNPRSRSLTLKIKDQTWCEPSGDKGQFAKRIDLPAYKKLADDMAALSNWTNRSE